MKESLNVAIIGCGMRARDVVSIFFRQLGDKLKIRAVYDPNPESLQLFAKKLERTLPENSPSIVFRNSSEAASCRSRRSPAGRTDNLPKAVLS